MTTSTKTELFRDMTTERLIALQDEYEYTLMCAEAVNSWIRNMADAVRKELASRDADQLPPDTDPPPIDPLRAAAGDLLAVV